MKKYLSILLVSLSLLVSCQKEETYYLRSFVMKYMDAQSISLREYSNGISIRADFLSSLGDFQSTGQLRESYDALCRKHNDMTFMRKKTVFPYSWTTNIGIDFLSIDVISDSDFDAEHPANTSLADVVIFSSHSLKPFIDSGYESKYDGREYHPFKDVISNLSSEQLILLGKDNYIGSLTFNAEPTSSKTHKFTVTMTADDGRVFTASIDKKFE